jgi:hypothetical protein
MFKNTWGVGNESKPLAGARTWGAVTQHTQYTFRRHWIGTIAPTGVIREQEGERGRRCMMAIRLTIMYLILIPVLCVLPNEIPGPLPHGKAGFEIT